MKRRLCRRERNFSLLLIAVGKVIGSGQLSVAELSSMYGGTEAEVKEILLAAKEEQEQYVDAYKDGIR